MQSIDLNLMRVLDAVLDTGSVTAAANRLHLSVPATSHALARLRHALGDPLLVRAGRRLVPTPRALEPSDLKLGRLTALLEPAMILLMGGSVGFVVFSILTPIMDMNNFAQ